MVVIGPLTSGFGTYAVLRGVIMEDLLLLYFRAKQVK